MPQKKTDGVILGLRLPVQLKKSLERAAAAKKLTLSDYCRQALTEAVNAEDGEGIKKQLERIEKIVGTIQEKLKGDR